MSQTTPKKSSKRKTMDDDASAPVQVRVAEASGAAGPAFLNFPCVRPSTNLPYTVYSRNPGSSNDITKQHTVIAAETGDVEFFSINRDIGDESESKDCKYLPAVYDPKTGTLDVYASAPLYLMGHRVKRLKEAPLSGPNAAADYRAKRNDLGELFGTRKAKTQIRAEERNKVDVDAMEGIKDHLMDSISGSVSASADGTPSELIPQPNLGAVEPASVYPRDSLISEAEWSAIDATGLLRAEDDKARTNMLPYRRSRLISDKMRIAVSLGSTTQVKKNVVRMAFFLSAMLQMYSVGPGLSKLSKPQMAGKFPGVPPQLLDGLLERFTETAGKKHMMTGKTQTKLLAWICVASLHLEEYNVDVKRLADELRLPPNKVIDMFKSLGCKVDVPSPAERERMGLSLQDARANRRASLKTPVVFPRQRTGAPSRR